MLLGGMCGDGRASLGSSGGLGGAPGRQNVNHLALVDILSTRAAHPTISDGRGGAPGKPPPGGAAIWGAPGGRLGGGRGGGSR